MTSYTADPVRREGSYLVYTQGNPNTPFCDLCGPFRTNRVRKVGRPDEFGQEYRCSGCDKEES